MKNKDYNKNASENKKCLSKAKMPQINWRRRRPSEAFFFAVWFFQVLCTSHTNQSILYCIYNILYIDVNMIFIYIIYRLYICILIRLKSCFRFIVQPQHPSTRLRSARTSEGPAAQLAGATRQPGVPGAPGARQRPRQWLRAAHHNEVHRNGWRGSSM